MDFLLPESCLAIFPEASDENEGRVTCNGQRSCLISEDLLALDRIGTGVFGLELFDGCESLITLFYLEGKSIMI